MAKRTTMTCMACSKASPAALYKDSQGWYYLGCGCTSGLDKYVCCYETWYRLHTILLAELKGETLYESLVGRGAVSDGLYVNEKTGHRSDRSSRRAGAAAAT